MVRKVCTKSGHVSTIPPVVKNNSHHGISTIKSDYPLYEASYFGVCLAFCCLFRHSSPPHRRGFLADLAECAHEWTPGEEAAHDEEKLVVKDANGTLLADGDSVTIVKTLKVKGASTPLKIGTKVKNSRLVEGDHNIDCRIDGFGAMQLKSEFVKKL